mmetsp:Transcript_25178/g.33409  ORF Transcript_25178/g.33409 Transcript_25178/m.33409 type:complete len:260 (-) Transcript_25178:181-960(-)
MPTKKFIEHMAKGQWVSATELLQQDSLLAHGRYTYDHVYGVESQPTSIFAIHQAVACHAPVTFIEALIKAYPKGVHKEDTAFQRVPLHIACRNKSSKETIELLLEYGEEAAAHQDNLGRIPLHYALSHGASVDLVMSLLMASPNSTCATDKAGWTPLHVACNQGSPFSVIEALVREDPKSVIYKTDSNGSTALTLATKCTSSPDKENILNLLQKKESEMVDKTEYVRIRDAEEKAASLKQKDRLTVRKCSKRDSVRAVI